jgi:NTP pyrophosphatase (non-canonical NTP hydrolase)
MNRNNEQRRYHARDAIQRYSDKKENTSYTLYDEPEAVITDLITDIIHYARFNDIDIELAIKTAWIHYEDEK